MIHRRQLSLYTGGEGDRLPGGGSSQNTLGRRAPERRVSGAI